MNDTIVGHRLFVDGVTRPVYLDEWGHQYVVDDDWQKVFGVGPYPEQVPDVPVIVEKRTKGE